MKNGFTLLEMLVVILIIGVLSAVAMPYFFNAVENARLTELRLLWGRQKDWAIGKNLTEEERAKINEQLQKKGLKHFSGEVICRDGAPEGQPCFEVVFTRNAGAGAQYQITTVHNFRELACVPTNILGTSFCKSRAKPGGETTVGGKTAYLMH